LSSTIYFLRYTSSSSFTSRDSLFYRQFAARKERSRVTGVPNEEKEKEKEEEEQEEEEEEEEEEEKVTLT